MLKTVRNAISETLRRKGSKFIGFLSPAGSVGMFEKELERIKIKYSDATHHCFAYRIDPNDLQEFTRDDGEPGGTAGIPILNQLKSYEIVNAGLIVVRYFGGTKLGKPGLIRAYGETASHCLERAELIELTRTETVRVIYPYNRQNQIDRLKSIFGLVELESEYLKEITLVLACPLDNTEQLYKELERLEHLDIRFEKMGADFISG